MSVKVGFVCGFGRIRLLPLRGLRGPASRSADHEIADDDSGAESEASNKSPDVQEWTGPIIDVDDPESSASEVDVLTRLRSTRAALREGVDDALIRQLDAAIASREAPEEIRRRDDWEDRNAQHGSGLSLRTLR